MTEEITIGGFILGIIALILKFVPIKKAFLGILIILLSFFSFDLLSGFTYYQFTKANEDLIQGIMKIKGDSLKDSKTIKLMDSKILELSQREHYSTLLSRVLLKVSNSFSQPIVNVPQTQKVETHSQKIKKYSISKVVELFSYKFLSSGWLMIILIIVLNLFFIMTSKNLFESIFCCIFLSFIFLSISLSIANLCDLIPVFYSIYLNYFINFIVGTLTPVSIIYCCATFAYQYEDYIGKFGVIMPNPDNYDSIFTYLKAIFIEVNVKLRSN